MIHEVNMSAFCIINEKAYAYMVQNIPHIMYVYAKFKQLCYIQHGRRYPYTVPPFFTASCIYDMETNTWYLGTDPQYSLPVSLFHTT